MTEPAASDSHRSMSRRSAIAATAWSLPVLAVAVTAPASAASAPAAVQPELTVSTAQPQRPGSVVFRVTVPTAQLPLPGETTLLLERTSSTGSISSASFVGTWSYSWPSSGRLEFSPTASVTPMSDFTVNLTGPATWTLTLTVPGGPTLTQFITVTAPV